jgi:hypothetical protein
MSAKPVKKEFEVMITEKKILNGSYTLQKKAELVHELSNAMKELVVKNEQNWLWLGMIWHFMTINKLWSAYGTHIQTASDFLKEVDLGVTRRSLEYYASIVKSKVGDYMVEQGLVIPMTKLRTIAPMIKTDRDVKLWCDKAKDLPFAALKDEVTEARGGKPTDTCKHPVDKLERWVRCGCCGKWINKQG